MKTIRTILAALTLACAARANNLPVSNVTLTDLDTVGDTVNVKFDVTWANSWRITDPTANWDAAWLFVKFHTGDLIWRHASLDTTDANHTAPAGGAINTGLTGTRGVGIFLYRSAPGTGTASFANVKLKWRYGIDGIADNARVSVDVTGIEMVYIPQGAFFVGDGSTASTRRLGDTTGQPFQIPNSGPIAVGTVSPLLGLWNQNTSGLTGGTSYTSVPTSFPNGFNAFYCMKYEPSQGERAAAANKGGPVVQNNGSRQVFTVAAGVATATTPERAYHEFSTFSSPPTTLGAYLDWAALRPMTEFEYEKACRGPVTPLPGEYAWGHTAIAITPYTLADDGTTTERVATGYQTDRGNAWNPVTRTASGPCRVGMFAIGSYSGTVTPRVQSGATYYGVMDMTGNVDEAVVTWPFSLAATPGFIFSGQHGDGTIFNNAHNVTEWGTSGNIGSSASGFIGWKGGSWNAFDSNRTVSGTSSATGGPYHVTMRGVRIAP